jgi:hypothetical protein
MGSLSTNLNIAYKTNQCLICVHFFHICEQHEEKAVGRYWGGLRGSLTWALVFFFEAPEGLVSPRMALISSVLS